MQISPLASSSLGNSYMLQDGKTSILIDCGIPIKEIKVRTDYYAPAYLDGCIVTHSHKDHSKSVKDLLKSGVNCYLSKYTIEELGLSNHHRLHTFKLDDENFFDNRQFKIGTFDILPLAMNHDVPCAGFLIYSNVTHEKLLFATDTYYIRHKVDGLDYIMIEANYDYNILQERINNGDVNMAAKDRLLKSHMSIDTTIEYLKSTDLRNVKRIYLMHLSGGSANAKEFKERVQRATGKVVIVCEE